MVTPVPADDELLTVPEAAAVCGVSETTLRRHIREGRLRARRLGRMLCIRRWDLDAYLEAAPASTSGDNGLAGLIGMFSDGAGVSQDKYRFLADAYDHR